jgi:hypothetical protein
MRQSIRFRQAAQQAPPAQAAASAAAPPIPSFATDIMPIFKQFQGPMMWRLDLTSYEAVVANAATIYSRISDPGNPMPPPPFPPLTQEQIDTFNTWMQNGCPP